MNPTGRPASGDSAFKTIRKRTAPKHLVDNSNSEAPNTAHRAIVDETQARLNAAGTIAILIKAIEDLAVVLPSTVAEGTDEDEIHRVLTSIHGHDEEAMCRDMNSRLHLILRGELGMLMVIRYLREIRWNAPEMNLEGAAEKLERVVKEMEFLSGTTRADAWKAAPRRKFKHKTQPTNDDPKKRKIFVVDGVAAVPPSKSEAKNLQTGGKRGPKSESRDHYWPPVATTKTGGTKRWSFTCRHCKIAVTFKRTVGKTPSPAPNLGNLSTHLKQQHECSAKIMADFLVDGKLNPAINSTQGNFYKIFATWIIEDDLAFTTGETPGIERLFAFLRAR
ncbi:hypothetical protein DFH08DRAFT_976233 [Mycena albidolilacea]|uniref:Uncharacterized protein n=1 Tax=Mycena albidolilacea TaxID=1033008 RepID=A0AAD6Z453_9AGAR|nr:hypothetical protein DFH08DRAFT_976233 [Mycena albidolilacea]